MGEEQKAWQDAVVIVTGASSGIGRETAWRFTRRGARVALAARRMDQLEETAAALPEARERFLSIPTDVTRDEDVQRLIDRTVERWGRIDVLVNNAGIGLRATVADTEPSDARQLMDVNFFGALRCIRAVVPQLARQQIGPRGVRGQIVNVGSILSLIATPANSLYAASKFALRALNDALRIELKDERIDVILVMPGYTDTAFFDNMIRYGGPARTTSWDGQAPSQVAAAIESACRHRRRELVLTTSARLGAYTKRISPRFLDWCLARIRHNP